MPSNIVIGIPFETRNGSSSIWSPSNFTVGGSPLHNVRFRARPLILLYLLLQLLFGFAFQTFNGNATHPIYNDCFVFESDAIVLEKYGLSEFVPLVEGVRKGDLRTFQDALVLYQDRFIRYVG